MAPVKLSGPGRGTLAVLLWASVAGLLIAVVSTGFEIYSIWQGEASMSVNVANSYFPELAEDNPRVLSGSYETAWLTVEGMPAAARCLLSAAVVMRHLVVVAVCAAMALVCRRILQYRPFAKSSAIALAVVGAVFVATAVLPGMFESVATIISAESLGLPGPDQIETREVVDVPMPPIDVPLVALGLFFGMIATSLQMGGRMFRDPPSPAATLPYGPEGMVFPSHSNFSGRNVAGMSAT
ncbi:hypothetical protein [Arthrobacter sp. ISL-28]|uniref:hypothetical protein n=1 Tax=Arthrobacter sp. ISL-28 TaxID=2819108 RepID=UPI001BE5125A|nr:hypothetical protein [Arthrobacter sp. ISL-28]MBT2519688.1 hypothetical protein [Arthrobacter sp. ISL-28]